ncbi:hypothetical protein LPUS_03998 [Lasallia pustulata]|uniref:Uncharacterized protein n=1 Tax=Lasallia pustulata TaxID=136370 RepID=A0A1W5CW99_9LECA|nr:hypothetical protein LPUS_03998 [Lasallia pustulata]
MSHPTGQALQDQYEIRPDPHALTHNPENPSENPSPGVDYTPHPEHSLKISPAHEKIVRAITNLYSGSASEEDMQVYAEDAVYDDPWSYCDARYKIAGQWYGTPPASTLSSPPAVKASQSNPPPTHPLAGLPKIMASSRTLATEIVAATATSISYKQRQEYTPRVVRVARAVDSLITLTLDEEGKVRYHKDMWNEKDYSHGGVGKWLKTLNGDHLTKITRPPEGL